MKGKESVKQVKQDLYLANEVAAEVKHEAARLERSVGWIVRHAWRLARDQIRAMPTVPPDEGADDEGGT